ncbi:MAG TPA: hypothetical protein VEF53_01750, partial [Patescibacteria group bacterium]|nr:hypothetical protein [Patescibacteria group bacterium]
MINVSVTIDAILLYCDESVTSLNLGNGYVISKANFDDLSYKNKVTDGNGHLTINYLGSRIYGPNNTISLMCLHKDEVFQIQQPQFGANGHLTDQDLMCPDQLEAYKDSEMAYLNKIFALLNLYKMGNFGPKEVFFEYHFTVMDFIKNTQKQTSDNVTRNIVNPTIFSLTSTEVIECNQFIMRVSSPEFAMLKNSIDEFVWGLEQVDIPTAFEQYTTALE